MVLPAIIALGSLGARMGFSGSMSQIFGAGAKTMGTSLLFGSGYSLGTYIGFPRNYQTRNTSGLKSFGTINNTMPYGRRSYGGYSRYPRRRYGYRRRSYRRSYY